MNAKTVAYWITTGLLALFYAFSGVGYLSGAMDEAVIGGLGYPAVVVTLLGVWKLLAVPALLAPGLPVLKQWAYAGVFFNLTGAVASHLAAGHGPGGAAPALFALALWAVSYALHAPVRLESAVVTPFSGAPVAAK